MSYLDYEKLETIAPAQFQQAKPYPWLNPLEYDRNEKALPRIKCKDTSTKAF
jgi:hypothetical protein